MHRESRLVHNLHVQILKVEGSANQSGVVVLNGP